MVHLNLIEHFHHDQNLKLRYFIILGQKRVKFKFNGNEMVTCGRKLPAHTAPKYVSADGVVVGFYL
jgi:hypothetical protein